MNTRLPNFLYLGPDKAGSTWLHETLIKHPDIFLTPAKDLYFFDRYYDRGEDWYARCFANAADESVVGEVCQDYLAAPAAADRIADMLGAPQLMVSLRDPADRAYSSYLYMRKHGEGPSTFREALDTHDYLLEHGRYGTQLRRYLKRIPQERVYLGLFDDLRSDPQGFLDGALAWLGVAPYALSEEESASKLPASRARWTPAAWIARRGAEVVRRLDGHEMVGRIKRSALVHRVLYQPLASSEKQIPVAERDWIREQLADEVAMVEADFGTDLQQRWGWK